VIPLGTSSVDVDVGDRNGCDDITGGKSKMSSTATNATSLIVRVSHIVQLVLVEVQWSPDCDHAVKQRPLFWDEILNALYLDYRSVFLSEYNRSVLLLYYIILPLL